MVTIARRQVTKIQTVSNNHLHRRHAPILHLTDLALLHAQVQVTSAIQQMYALNARAAVTIVNPLPFVLIVISLMSLGMMDYATPPVQ